MADFPAKPVAPSEFFESFLPQAFAEAEIPAEMKEVELQLGVHLAGEGGGEWLFEIKDGKLRVAQGSRNDAAFSIVQSVEDWRGALWEGRGGAIGQQASAMFRPGGLSSAQAAAPGGMGGAPSPAALQQMRALNGMIRMTVTGAQGGDWSVAFKLGPGDVPAEPTTTVTISSDDAAAMQAGTLNPMQAFMEGRIQVGGDMTLMMQMQAIQMQAAAQAAAKPKA